MYAFDKYRGSTKIFCHNGIFSMIIDIVLLLVFVLSVEARDTIGEETGHSATARIIIHVEVRSYSYHTCGGQVLLLSFMWRPGLT